MNRTEFNNISFEGNCSYEASLRDSVRKDYHSEMGREQRKHLNPGFRSLIEDFIDGKDVNRLDLVNDWTRPANKYCDIELQTYFNYAYLKEVGLYEIAKEARDEFERNKDKYIRADIAHQAERDRNNYRERYEDKDSKTRRHNLNFEFHKAIRRYLYHGGEVPKLMDCFDAPIEILKNYEIVEKVLNDRAIREEKAYNDLLKIAKEL